MTALVLPLLLLAHWLFRSGNHARERFFKALAGSLLVLLLVIMASALYRMWLYLQAFGLTELRFYATAFMIWLVHPLLVVCCNGALAQPTQPLRLRRSPIGIRRRGTPECP